MTVIARLKHVATGRPYQLTRRGIVESLFIFSGSSCSWSRSDGTRLGRRGRVDFRRRHELLSPTLTVVVQNSVPVARMGSATTSQQFVRQVGRGLGVSAFVLAATVGGFRAGLLVVIAVSAGTFACILAPPAHSLNAAHEPDSDAMSEMRPSKQAAGLSKSSAKKSARRMERRG